jgi:hypothetical protein
MFFAESGDFVLDAGIRCDRPPTPWAAASFSTREVVMRKVICVG